MVGIKILSNGRFIIGLATLVIMVMVRAMIPQIMIMINNNNLDNDYNSHNR